jgi:sarcosine oxidase delta subunit
MSGQCGRLKCCLNYELDTYNDAMKKFPRNADKIETDEGVAYLKKTEVLKKLMWYEYEGTRNFFKLNIDTVAELLFMNKQGKKPASLNNYNVVEKVVVDESKHDDLVGQVSLATLEDKARKKNKNFNKGGSGNKPQQQNRPQNKPQNKSHNKPFNKPKPDAPKKD